mgnify:CR=1 FL=1
MPLHERHPIAKHQAMLAERQRKPQVDLKSMPPETAEALVIAAIEVVARYLPPDGITQHEALNELIELFDSPKAWEIYEAEMNRRSPRDVDSWN